VTCGKSGLLAAKGVLLATNHFWPIFALVRILSAILGFYRRFWKLICDFETLSAIPEFYPRF
jgi:hypothetical protein